MRHLSFCKNILIFFDEDSEEKWGLFFFLLFFVGVQEKRNIYFTRKEKKKKERKKSGNWDLISFPHCSSVIGFTDVCTHTFMLNCRLYNT